MMHIKSIKNSTVLAMILVLLTASLGCSSKGHKKNVAAAHKRVNKFRSGLMIPMIRNNLEAGDLDEAKRGVMDALVSDPKNAKLYVLDGRIELEKSNLERAMILFQVAIELDDKVPTAYYYRGIVQQRWSRFEEALKSYAKAFKLRRDHVDFLLATAEMHIALGQTKQGLDLLLKYENYFESSAGLRASIGQVYAMLKEYKKSAQYYREALLIKPDDLALSEDLAFVYYRSKRYEDANRMLMRLVANKKYNARKDVMYALADSFERVGDRQSANRIYIDLTQKNKNDVHAWVRLSEISWALNEIPSAMEAAQRVIELKPKQYEGYFLAGMAALRSGEFKTASTYFDKCAVVDAKQTSPLILSGMMFEKQGDTAQAAQRYRKALKRDPKDQRAKHLLASVMD